MENFKRVTYIAAAITVVFFAWIGSIDVSAESQVNAGLKRALTTYATARTLNAVISVAQGTEVSIQPLGMGVNFTPGQVLSPIHELVEQFSNVMLLASVAFGIQKIFILIGSHWLVSIALSICIAIAVGLLILRPNRPLNWIGRCLFVLLLLRFAVPVSLTGTEFLFNSFMKAKYESSQKSITSTTTRLGGMEIQPKTVPINPSMLDKIKNLTPDIDVSARVRKLQISIETATEHVISLITVFLMQTLLLPLFFLWCLFTIAKSILNPRKQFSALPKNS